MSSKIQEKNLESEGNQMDNIEDIQPSIPPANPDVFYHTATESP